MGVAAAILGLQGAICVKPAAVPGSCLPARTAVTDSMEGSAARRLRGLEACQVTVAGYQFTTAPFNERAPSRRRVDREFRALMEATTMANAQHKVTLLLQSIFRWPKLGMALMHRLHGNNLEHHGKKAPVMKRIRVRRRKVRSREALPSDP